MRRSSIFLNSFLDGFTMSGFLGKLRLPGAPVTMFAPAVPEDRFGWADLTFKPGSQDRSDVVQVSGNLHNVPEQALQTMLKVLQREAEDRKLEVRHGASR